MSDLVTVGNYFDRISAEIAKGVLDSDGIDSCISAGDMAGTRPSLLTGAGGVWLVVRAEDAGRASELLQAVWQDGDTPGSEPIAASRP